MEKKVIALIPARSGSKGIKDKNIIDFKGKPLIAHSIIQSVNSKFIDDVYVSTDSINYAEISKKYGAIVPFIRPESISGDFSTDLEVFKHFLSWYKESKNENPDIIVHLRPTYPTRKVIDLDNAIRYFIKNYKDADSLRSVVVSPYSPYKMWRKEGKYLKQIISCSKINEPYNKPRQKLPTIYWQNACIDITKSDTILKKNSMSGEKILTFEMNKREIFDIDEIQDFKKIK